MIQRNAIALLADGNYLEQTKQVILSSYKFGNWSGDYILFAHEIEKSELSWFKAHGVEVFETYPLLPLEEIPNMENKGKIWPKVVYDKLFLLHPEMKKWEKIIYLDTDVIVRKDINQLSHYKSFAAREETMKHNLLYQFVPDLKYCSENHKQKIKLLQQKYNFNEISFNVGIMVIPTAPNTTENFNKALQIAREIHDLAYFPEQAVFNLHFYKNWENIPYIYNDCYTHDTFNRLGIWGRKTDDDAVILHCVGAPKPWIKTNPYFSEWSRNMKESNNLFNVPQQGEIPTTESQERVERINSINRYFGRWNRFLWKCKVLVLNLLKSKYFTG